MLKTNIKLLFAAVFLLAALLLCACEEVPSDHEHVYAETVVEPTCDEAGHRYLDCEVCGEKVIEEIAPLGHTIENGKKELSRSGRTYRFTETGYCTVCGKKDVTGRDFYVSGGISESRKLAKTDIPDKGGFTQAYLNDDDKLYLSADPDDNYMFLGWSDGNTEFERIYDGKDDVYAVYAYEAYNMPVVSIITENSQQIIYRDHYIPCSVSV